MDGGPLHQKGLPSSMAFDVTLDHRSLASQYGSERLLYSRRCDMQYNPPEKISRQRSRCQKGSVFITPPKRWTLFHLELFYVGLCCAKRQV